MSRTQIRGNKQIKAGSITNAEVAADAAIALSKIAGGSGLVFRVTTLESDQMATREVPSGNVNGSNTVFTLANAPVEGSEKVYVNGILVESVDGYTILSNSITFSEAPQSGDEIHVSYAYGEYSTTPSGSSGGGESSPVGSLDYGTVVGESAVSGSQNWSAFVRSDGALLTAGVNSYGQLGHGDTETRYSPKRVGSDSNWSKVFCSEYNEGANFANYALAIKSSGTLWAWGHNNYGQLGQGDTSVRYAPTQIGSSSDWATAAAGIFTSLAIKTDGTLWSWGYGEGGSLGDGANSNRSSPAQVGDATNWSKIVMGADHVIALKTDGTLWSWGWNAYGQLGLGDNTSRNSPVQIGSGSNWTDIAAGWAYTLAVKSDGTLWAWGHNQHGQLGVGDSSNRNAPTQVGDATSWSQVSAGSWHSMAKKSDGTIWGFGLNNYYHLGDGTTTTRNSPVQIGKATDWMRVTCTVTHTFAIKTDGSVWGWGDNTRGQLGHGTTTQKYGPAKAEVDLDV